MKSVFLESWRKLVGPVTRTTNSDNYSPPENSSVVVFKAKPDREQVSATTGKSLEPKSKEQFDQITKRIAALEFVEVKELLPFLCREHTADRVYVNYQLAYVYHHAGKPEIAKAFIERAWILSRFDAEILALYRDIHSALGETTAIREAHKRLGLVAAEKGDIQKAIEQFDQAHFTYALLDRIDRWEYDHEIMSSLNRLAEPLRCQSVPTSRPASAKIRIGYLLRGIVELNSILMDINLTICRLHDKSKFEIFCFALEPSSYVTSSLQGLMWKERLAQCGVTVCVAPDIEDLGERIIAVSKQIASAQLDLLVTCAGLADYSQYFLCSLRPAPLMVGIIAGPPAQFAPPILDWCISWSKHPLMDTPVNCSLVEFKTIGKQAPDLEPYSKEQFHLPPDACVLVSGGRPEKFQDRVHWAMISEILCEHPRAYYLAAGPSDENVSFLDSIIQPSVRDRVRCLGWRKDFRKILTIADIIVDTYPNGGGQTLFQPMAMGIPIVCYENDYMHLFDQTNWSPADSFICDPRVLLPRGDFAKVKEAVGKLIRDLDYRRHIGDLCLSAVNQLGPEDSVRQCEDIYKKLLGR